MSLREAALDLALQVRPIAGVFARKAVAAVTGQKNPAADHDGGRSTRTRQLSFPDEVAVVAPGNGHSLVGSNP
jgi:hypothetical protein